ncbi:MAG: hypothetical protein FWH40_08385 [Coriobacteriia bacterium]|nr:hypothetical protein [Coriobacteriia bacterium]
MVRAFDAVEEAIGLEPFCRLFGLVLLDNGVEFSDAEGMERSATEPGRKRCRVFYCDPMQSQQRPGSEKHHSELRQVIPKNSVSFDALDAWDVSVACSQVNSTPRKSLLGSTPIKVLRALFGPEADLLLDCFGVTEAGRDELTLKPRAINEARARRGLASLSF